MSSSHVMEESLAHRIYEDLFAIVIGTSMVSFGVILLKQAGALTGSIAGLAFLLHYLTHTAFGVFFFLLNLPFYYLAIHRMGWPFTIKTFSAVACVSVFSEWHPLFIHIDLLNPFYAAIFGNILMGVGFIVLFRHKMSLGGINVLALYLQDRGIIKAGKLQMIIDTFVLFASFFIVSKEMMIASLIGAFIMNMIITINHRPERYLG
jgi:uncharacterized membrane-anchored protein YitT (DUF2179 family)